MKAVDRRDSSLGYPCRTVGSSFAGVNKGENKSVKGGKLIDGSHWKAHGVAAVVFILKYRLTVECSIT